MTFNKNITTGLAIGVVAFLPSFAHANEAQYQNMYVSGLPAGDTLNIRNIDNYSEILDTVKEGDIIIKLESLSWKKGWSKVKTSRGIEGICNDRYLSSAINGNTSNLKITAKNIELRTGAGKAYRIYKTVPKGTEVEYISTSGDWAKIKFEGRLLYAPKYYIVDKNNSVSEPVKNDNIGTSNNQSNGNNEVVKENDSQKIYKSSASLTTSKSSSASVYNAKLALSKLNGKVIKPGEKFSFLNSVGSISTANGYKESTVLINGKPDTGVGGGVCLASSVVFNAMVDAGIEPLHRRNHSLASSYVARGLDAMVSTGSSDLTFINKTGKTLVMNTSVGNGWATVSFSSEGDHKNGYTFKPRVTLSGDKKTGNTYLQKFKDGEFVSEKLITRSSYRN